MAALFGALCLCFGLIFGGVAAAEDADSGAPEAEGAAKGAEDAADEVEKPPRTSPVDVTVGVYLNDIQSIDLKTHTYAVDAYFWFVWSDDGVDPSLSWEFVNPNELWGHMATPAYEEPHVQEDGSLYQVVRVQGRFSKKLPLFNYPFDRQSLDVVFEDTVNESKDLRYVPSPTAPVTLNPKLTLPGYLVGTPTLVVEEFQYPTNFGDIRFTEPSKHSRVTVALPITRPVLAYAIKLLLPVYAVMIGAALMFVLGHAYLDARVGIGITALLTVVALQMSFNTELPDVGYLMLMDRVYLASYLFVIAGLAVVIWTTKLGREGREERAVTVNRWSLRIAGSAYVLATAALVATAMIQG